MLGHAEQIFSGEAFGAPVGGQTTTEMSHTVNWPGGGGVLVLDSLLMEGGATLQITSIGLVASGVALPKLNAQLAVGETLAEGSWSFSLPEAGIVFTISLPIEAHIALGGFWITRAAS